MNEEVKQEYGTLVAKKSERLVTALYLVTDLISEHEPIKQALRKNAVGLLSSMNTLSQIDVKDRIVEFKMSLKAVTEITSLLHVAVTTGIVSEMNGQLLRDGFRSLQSALERKQPIFTKEMLRVEHEEELMSGEHAFNSAISSTSYDALTPLALARLHDTNHDLRKTHESLKQSHLLSKLEAKDNKGQNKDKGQVSSVSDKNESKGDSIKDTEKSQLPKNQTSTHSIIMGHSAKPAVLASSFQMRKYGRKEQILALFVKGVDVSIKDIASRIRGCSEKTIQRELNALLYDNVIERIGEKRWSRYVLR